MEYKQADLIEQCITGDETAIAQLIEQYQAGVFRLALSILNDSEDANEVTQDTFISALKALHSYRETSTFRAWLYRIALNNSRSRLRKRKNLERLQQTLTANFEIKSTNHPSPEDVIIGKENDADTWKAVETLGEKHRTPIILRYYHDLSVAEIAEIMNIKIGTVHSRLSIGREKLCTYLRKLQRVSGEKDE